MSSAEALFMQIGLDDWVGTENALRNARLSPRGHGDMPGWLAAIDQLPALSGTRVDLSADAVTIDGTPEDADALVDSLRALMPWRKGPFRVGGVHIDTEWRSDWKWSRVAPELASLEGRQVLDVGCGNGYYAFRMLGAGAKSVVGIDPTLLFSMQFRAINHYVRSPDVHLVPARLEELPDGTCAFDTVFSMGVLYHQRSPIDHLRQLKSHLRPGGELVLETLVLPGDSPVARTPEDRYAHMRNVWLLPSVPELETWLARCGDRDIRVVDVTMTTVDEQRSTEWMSFESLAQSLDAGDPSLTIEGWPAPTRAVITATTG